MRALRFLIPLQDEFYETPNFFTAALKKEMGEKVRRSKPVTIFSTLINYIYVHNSHSTFPPHAPPPKKKNNKNLDTPLPMH